MIHSHKFRKIKSVAGKYLSLLPFPYYNKDYHLPDGFRRIYHYHVRKTAGSAINRVFYNIAGDGKALVEKLWKSGAQRINTDDYVFVGHNLSLINRGDYFYAASHKPSHELNLKAHTYTITSLRDPVSRIVSHFRMLHDYNEMVPKHPALAKKKEGLFLKDTLDEFLEILPKEKLLNQIYMFSNNLDRNEACANLLKVNSIVMMEDFDEGIAKIGGDLQIDLKPSRANVTKTEISIPQSSLDKAREMLNEEYLMLDELRRHF